jgi:hypothetical protein
MEFTTLSQRNRVTISVEIVHELGLVPGMKLKQWIEDGRLVMEPLLPKTESQPGRLDHS